MRRMKNTRIVIKESKMPGKTVAIIVGVHGNELCGVNALNKIIPKLKINSGKAIFIYANLEAIKQNKRFIEKNLNRCFLEEQSDEIKNTLEDETAREIIPFLEEAEVMLDIHASNSPNSQPFVICSRDKLEDAKMFDINSIVYGFDKFEFGTTGGYMELQEKSWFVIECGYLDNPESQDTAEKSINEFLIHFGLTNGINKSNKNQKKFKILGLYKNKFGVFKSVKDFRDLEKMGCRTLIGFDGDNEVYVDKEKVVLFVRDREKLNEECFLIGEES